MSRGKVLVRGGGDLATGVIARLHRVGFQILVTELAQPLVVRRMASVAEAIYAGVIEIEDLKAQRATTLDEANQVWLLGVIPVLIDPDLDSLPKYQPDILVDARMIKRAPEIGKEVAELVIGLGPGFTAGENCHAVIETLRGHTLGRVYWQGQALANTGLPEIVGKHQSDRVLRAPQKGVLQTYRKIGDRIIKGEVIAEVSGESIQAPFDGVLRGLLMGGLSVKKGMKIGDLDPRNDPAYCGQISDKALSIGGGVLEAVFSERIDC